MPGQHLSSRRLTLGRADIHHRATAENGRKILGENLAASGTVEGLGSRPKMI